ncbi:basic amino acid ABC transporter substrate-binding protein [Fusobacterium necrophorum]|nr:basic amino acid ABC transporter substrate-binding protein [Fusobacterium necrophorum]
MKWKKRIFVVICCLLCFACGKGKEEATLVVGTNPEFAPFEYMEGEEIKGFDIELMKQIGEKIGKKVEIKSMNFDGLLPALQSKKIDVVIAGMAATEERKKHVNFTKNYYISQQNIMVKENKEHDLEALKGQKIGVVLGYTGDVFISSKHEYAVERFNSASAAILALQADKVSAVILDEEPAKQYVKQNPGLSTFAISDGKEEYAIALHKDNVSLLKDIDKALESLKQDGSYDKLYQQYFTK